MEIKHDLFGLLIFAFSIFVLSSCSGDYFGNNDRVEGDDVRLDMSVGLDTDLQEEPGIENSVKSVRVMVFVSTESLNAGVPPGCVLINERYDNPNEIPTQRFSPGLRDVYVVANETARMRAQLDKVTSVRQLQAINVEYDPAVPSVGKPFVMCAEHRNKRFEGGTTESLSLGLLRIGAKAHFKLSFDALAAGIAVGLKDRPLVVDSIRIMQISDSTMLSSSAPVYVSHKQIDSPLAQFTQPTNPKNWTITGDLYLTERLFAQFESTSDPTQATYMMIYAKLDGTACRYRINIGDRANPNAWPQDYTITRNTQYNITGTFTKIGETDGVDAVIEIAKWGEVPINGEVGGYIGFVRVARQKNPTVALPEKAPIDDMGEGFYVICSTNVGGWSAYTTDTKGNEVFRGTASAITTLQEQSISISIPALGRDVNWETFTIQIYHPTFAPKEKGVPLKSFKIVQYGGVIPNEVLVQSFTATVINGSVLLPGWPEGKLPPQGIQIAKRGPKRYPNDVADRLEGYLIDFRRYLAPDNTKTALGSGAANTSWLQSIAQGSFGACPPAEMCREMGPEWYLPSRDELLLFGKRQREGYLGSSYLMVTAIDHGYQPIYNSSSGQVYGYSWALYINTYGAYRNNVSDLIWLRCVRNI